ncbi:hypothetical protein Tco_1363646 [Tanacetum coccineum]
MQKVAKLLSSAESLILPSREVNVVRAADKSLSRTVVQSSIHPKAITSKKSRKKQNPNFFEPKTSTYGLDASKPAEEVANQPKTATIKKDPRHMLAAETIEIPVTENLMEDIVTNDVGIVSLVSIQVDEVM